MKTSYRLETRGSHTHLTVWVNGANAGTLTVRNDEVDVLNIVIEALEVGVVKPKPCSDCRSTGLNIDQDREKSKTGIRG